MSKKTADSNGDFVMPAATLDEVTDHMKYLADFKPEMEPVMLRLARMAGFNEVEQHILRQRKLRAAWREGKA